MLLFKNYPQGCSFGDLTFECLLKYVELLI